MSYSQRSRRSHEESQHTKRAGDRVWMEELQGRVMLSAAQLDMSIENDIEGSGPVTYQFDAVADQRYIFSSVGGYARIALQDAQGNNAYFSGNDWGDWRASASGIYFLSIDKAEGETDDYSVIVRAVNDDFGNDPTTAGFLSQNQPAHGEIEDFGDRDWFRFDAAQGDRWAFDVAGNTSVYTNILDDNGRLLMYCDDGCQTLPYTGTYYVEIGDMYEKVGQYTISARRVVDDNQGGPGGAAPLAMGGVATGTIDFENDDDWFAFSAVEGTTYGFLGHGEKTGLALNVYDASGNLLPLADDIARKGGRRIDWVAPASGDYFLKARGYPSGSYSIRSFVQQKEDASTSPQTTRIEYDAGHDDSIEGTAGMGASKYFRFYAVKNATYRVYTDPGTLADGVIVALIAPDGKTVIDWNMAESWIQPWTASETGDCYLWVRSFDPSISGRFSIALDQALDDYGNSSDEGSAITVGAPVEGMAQYSDDEDWFKLDVVKGETYIFSLTHHDPVERQPMYRRRKNTPPYLDFSLLDANGQEISGGSTLWGQHLRFEWTATMSASVYLRVTPGLYWTEMPYTLSVDTGQTDPDPPEALTPDQTISVHLSANQKVVRLRMMAEAGKKYVINLGSDGDSAWYEIIPALGSAQRMPIDCWSYSDCEDDFLRFRDSGPYYVIIGTWDDQPSDVSVSLREPTNMPRPGKSGDGVIADQLADENDVRVYAMTARAGSFYVLQTVLGSLEDSILSIYDGTGHVLEDNDDVSDEDLSSRIEWTAKSDGTYYIMIQGYGGGTYEFNAYERDSAGNAVALNLRTASAAEAPAVFADAALIEEDDSGDSAGLLTDDVEVLDSSDQLDWGNL